MTTYGVILAGGKSSRMGENKSFLKVDGTPSVERVINTMSKVTDKRILITNDFAAYEHLGLQQYSDRYQDKGPLAGLETAFYHTDGEWYVIAACDMPFVHEDIFTYLLSFRSEDVDAIIPNVDGRDHPLSGIYKRSALPAIQKQIAANNLRVRSFFSDINVVTVDDFSMFDEQIVTKHFFNMNNPEQYKEAKGL